MIRPSRKAEVFPRGWARGQEWMPALSAARQSGRTLGSSWPLPGCAIFLMNFPSCWAEDEEGLGTGRRTSLEQSHLVCPGKNSGVYCGGAH